MAVGLWRPVVTDCLSQLFERRIPIGKVVDYIIECHVINVDTAEQFGQFFDEAAENPHMLHFNVWGLSKREKRVFERLMPDCCDGECERYRDGHPACLTGTFNGVNWKLTPAGTEWRWVKKHHFHHRGEGYFAGCDLPHRFCVAGVTLYTWKSQPGAE